MLYASEIDKVEKMRILVWFSCGAASAVAAKLSVEKHGDNCEVIYCDTLAYEHPDNVRFMRDVEKWIRKEIKIIRSEKYKDIYEVFDKGFLVCAGRAMCTIEMKKKPRIKYQRPDDTHVFGFTFDEKKRIDRFYDVNPELFVEFPLFENKITKANCYKIIQQAGIDIPAMYKLGYNNNNCIGCVKGGQGYWNKIRVDFPEIFEKMAKQERKLNIAINKTYAGDGKRKRLFLDEMPPDAGRDLPMPEIDCGVLCQEEV